MKIYTTIAALLSLMIHGLVAPCFAREYSWLATYSPSHALVAQIPVPQGYERISVPQSSFQDWLRYLPLRPGKSTVYLYNGKKKSTQRVHVAVVDIDVGTQDLQQCADAIIRLRAEYLYARQQYTAIHFNFTSGDTASFTKWTQGYRPQVRGNRVSWKRSQNARSSYRTFKQYLQTVFMYAGSYSLEQELQPVKKIEEMHIGDVFIQGGFPGHAVLVVDMAINPSTGSRVFLLAQSYMPAQDIHILRNPGKWWSWSSTPWYELDFGEKLHTPEWTFQKTQLKRFK
ncbi:MAG: DUF4846 domain-containing protein [bacterium]|nr:DUF4846 domain-containing protein [bacterium]